MQILSESVCLIVLPLALIDVAICVDKSASAVCLIVLPVALVQRTVCPNLNSLSISFASALIPVSFVSSSVLKSDLCFLGALNAVIGWYWVVPERSQAFLDFLHLVVVVVRLDVSVETTETGKSLSLEAVLLCHSFPGKGASDDSLNLNDESKLVLASEAEDLSFVEDHLLQLLDVGRLHHVYLSFLRTTTATITHLISKYIIEIVIE